MIDQLYFRMITDANSGHIYLRADDVVKMLQTLEATEDTDTRFRLKYLIDNIRKKSGSDKESDKFE